MALTNLLSNTAYVNTGTQNVPVYKSLVNWPTGGSTAGGASAGLIYPGEMFVCMGYTDKYATWHKIYFRNGSGAVAYGYIEEYNLPPETAGRAKFAWVSKQEPYHLFNANGSNLVRNSLVNCGGTNLYTFKLRYSSSFMDSNGTVKGTLPAGTTVGISDSTTGKSNQGWMGVEKQKSTSGTWTPLYNGSYGFVDMKIGNGAQPNDRNFI